MSGPRLYNPHAAPEDFEIVTEEPPVAPPHDVPALLAGAVCFLLLVLSPDPRETRERLDGTLLHRLTRYGTRAVIWGQPEPELELIECVVCNRVYIGELTLAKTCPACPSPRTHTVKA